MATLQNLRDRVANNLGRGTPNTDLQLFSLARLTAAINEGYQQFYADTRYGKRLVTMPAVDQQATYPLPSDVTRVLRVKYDTTVLQAVDPALLDAAQPNWQDMDSGCPDYWFVSGNAIQLVCPPSVTTAVSITAMCEIVPSSETGGIPLMVNTTDVPALPVLFHYAPAMWATANLAEFLFADDPLAQVSGPDALMQYQQMVKQFLAMQVNEGAYSA